MYIYKATNKDNGKFYIGQTKDFDSRKKSHEQSVFAKGREDNIEWEIIDTASSRDELNILERHYIKKLKPSYNIDKGGNYNRGALKELILTTPNDACFTQSLLTKMGISRQLVGSYVKSGWITKLDNGLFCKSFNKPDIKYACISEGNIHIGGLSAISRHGMAHYIRFDNKTTIYTNGSRPKKWLNSENFDTKVVLNKHTIFDSNFGVNDGVSSPERALIEMVYDTPKNHTINECRLILEAAYALRPTYIQRLLESCNSVGTKRLFLYLSRGFGWQWYDKLDKTKICLGSGKRQIVKGGKLDKEFQIVV